MIRQTSDEWQRNIPYGTIKTSKKHIKHIVNRLISRLWGIMMSVQQTSARVFRIYTCWFLRILGSREIYIVFTSSSKLVRKLVSLFLFVFDLVDSRQASPVSCHEATQVSQSMPKSNAFAKHVHCRKVENIRSSYHPVLRFRFAQTRYRPHEILTCSIVPSLFCGQNLLKPDSLLQASTWFGADAQHLFSPAKKTLLDLESQSFSWDVYCVKCPLFGHISFRHPGVFFKFRVVCFSVFSISFLLLLRSQVAAAFGLCGRPWVFAKARKTSFNSLNLKRDILCLQQLYQ